VVSWVVGTIPSKLFQWVLSLDCVSASFSSVIEYLTKTWTLFLISVAEEKDAYVYKKLIYLLSYVTISRYTLGDPCKHSVSIS